MFFVGCKGVWGENDMSSLAGLRLSGVFRGSGYSGMSSLAGLFLGSSFFWVTGIPVCGP